MTYFEAYNKVIEAYFRDEIKPFDPRFCFCGTLSPNCKWHTQSLFDKIIFNYPYSVDEYSKMEYYFFKPFRKMGIKLIGISEVNMELPYGFEYSERYEKLVFDGMVNALGILKSIHRERGENVDEEIPFVKRDLKNKVPCAL